MERGKCAKGKADCSGGGSLGLAQTDLAEAFSFAKLLQFSIKAIHTCMWWWICLYPPCIFVRVLPVRVFPIFHIKWKIFFMWPLLVFPPMRNGFFTRTPSKKASHLFSNFSKCIYKQLYFGPPCLYARNLKTLHAFSSNCVAFSSSCWETFCL